MKIKNIEKIEHESLRYDIEIKDNNNFFANGMLVHNSCGIMYEYKGNYGIATRGSFNSKQAIWATNLLNEKYLDAVKKLDTDNYTYVYEICYPSNRIVIDYGEFADIVFLARINKNTGVDEQLEDNISEIMKPFICIERFKELEHLSFEELQALNIQNREGFVLHGEDGKRIKVKFEDYCRLHSIITNITSRDIWRTLSQGKPVDEILDNVPDEFDTWVRNKVDELNTAFTNTLNTAKTSYESIKNSLNGKYTQKEFALENFKINKGNKFMASIVFGIDAGNDVTDKIWKHVFPNHEKPFMQTNEEDID